MNFYENFVMALKNLWSNKVRSFLTMLGVIIGVGAVITMVSIGEGAKAQITERIMEMGSNLLTVSAGRSWGRAGRHYNIDNSILPVLAESSPYIKEIAPTVRSNRTVKAGSKSMDVSITGCTPNFSRVRNYKVQYGRFFTEEEAEAGKRVAVIGSAVAEELFFGKNPVGEEIRIGTVRVEVVGVLEKKGDSGFGSSDEVVLIPLYTAQKRITGNKNLGQISLQIDSAEHMDQAYLDVYNALMLEFKDEERFVLNNMTEVLNTAQDMTKTMTMLLSGIAAVSLLVGGIGIMNIMLVSVTERIREIGIRKAIGARKEEILILFLMEALTLSLMGGMFGVVLGGFLSTLLSKLMGWKTVISLSSVLIAFTFSLMIGLFFGVYPAYKASGLNPIEALRHE